MEEKPSLLSGKELRKAEKAKAKEEKVRGTLETVELYRCSRCCLLLLCERTATLRGNFLGGAVRGDI